MIRNICALSIWVKVQIICHGRNIDAYAILDSGAEGIYCNTTFINTHRIPTNTLDTPIYPRNIDGTLNKQGPICHTAILQMEMGNEHKESTEMAITNIRHHDILLGTNWFKAHNPSIDWAKNQLCLNRCPHSCYPDRAHHTPTLGQLLPTEAWEDQYDDYIESKCYSIDASQCIMAHLQAQYNDNTKSKYQGIVVSQRNMAQYEPVVAQTMVSTTLAKAEQPKLFEIPPEFCQYSKVFSDKEAQ